MSAPRWLVAGAGRASLSDAPPDGAQILTVDPARAEQDATALVSKVCGQITDEIWQLELSAFAAMEHRQALLCAVMVAETAGPVALELPDGVRAETALGVARALLGQGGQRPWLAQLGAALMGWVILCLLVLRHGGSRAAALTGQLAGPLFAIHAEEATRTRHAVRLAAQDAAPTILLLGRPQADVAQARRAMDPQGILPEDARAVRPLSLGACVRGLPRGVSVALRGARALAQTGLCPAFRDRLAMSYRVMQGVAHALWWQGCALRPADGVFFGHTGTADTSLLERAMQADGLRTMHVMHGSGLGWSFAGLSDVAVFHSGADAEVAARLPAYGRCTHLPMPRPEAAPSTTGGDGRWLVLTSYTHPLNPDYAARGAEADIAVVKWVAQAAQALGQAPDQIIWRPHPMLAQTAPQARAALESAVQQAGFAPWPDGLPYEQMAAFARVITTPSTTLTDALRLGVAPVLAVAAPLQSDLVYGVYPVQARSAEDLTDHLRIDPATHLDAGWQAIRPGAPMSLAALGAALRG